MSARMYPQSPVAVSEQGLGRSPTFVVGSEKQRHILEVYQRRDQQFSEQYQKNRSLCFHSSSYQLTHPKKAARGCKDADATLTNPMILGVADGVSQIEEFGIDPALLPNELMQACEDIAIVRLDPDEPTSKGDDGYLGPISLMREAFESTESLGSTTALLAIMDNSTMIHGKLHPMIAVLSIGDCELLMLRRLRGRQSGFQAVFHTEMQRIDGHAQTPLQVARVDERVDPTFDEAVAVEVIERGSAVHCVSTYEGDIVVLGSDGVFDNLFLDEIVDLCNEMLAPPQPGRYSGYDPALLHRLARRIVEACHAKTRLGRGGRWPDTPIGRGGKIDDTTCVVGEVVVLTNPMKESMKRRRMQNRSSLERLLMCGGGGCHRFIEDDSDNEDEDRYDHYDAYSKSRGGDKVSVDEKCCAVS